MDSKSTESLPATNDSQLHLTDDELEILKSQVEVPPLSAGYGTIFRYASGPDRALLFLSALAAVAVGTSLPLMTVVFGSLAGQFSNALSMGYSSFADNARHSILYFVYLGVATLILATLSAFGFSYTGEAISSRIREAYLTSVLRQNIGFFDSTGAGEVTARITSDINVIQDGISSKVSLLISGISGFFAAIIVAFIKSWRLALVLLCIPLVVVLIMGIAGSRMKALQEASSTAYAESGSFAEEVISSIRNVTAYGSQARFQRKYEQSLESGAKFDFKAKFMTGTMIASLFAVNVWGYALAFWQGHRFYEQGNLEIGQMITVLFAMGIAGVLLGNAAPFVASIAQAGAAAGRIIATIDRVSPLDPLSSDGRTLESIKGDIKFRDLKFVYPSRMNQPILEKFNLHIEAGKTVAIVGPSGSGKTTLFTLLERLYSPIQGQILVDDVPIQDLNLRFLRSVIGLVSQDNFLFNTSVYDNIAYGLGMKLNECDQEKKTTLVEEAAKIANAHSFILELPEGYSTRVGERGSLLSGGQRQRIAIARAIISNPRILLLDEATAALDTKSENAVQKALQTAAKGRTTIIIAHRLSTVKHADVIVVMQQGKIIETGSHDELIFQDSTYARLVKTQQLKQSSSVGDENLLWSAQNEITGSGVDGEAGSKSTQPVWEIEAAKSSMRALVKLVWTLNGPERFLLVIGMLFSVLAGSGYPVQAIFFGNAIISIAYPEFSTGQHDLNFWAAMLFMLGFILFASYFTQGYCFAVVASRLTSRARAHAFAAILRQDMSFFDEQENSAGSLTAFLSVDAQKLTGISGVTLGAILNSGVTLLGGIAVACSFGWKLALVATSTVPILLVCGFFRFWIVLQAERHVKRETEASSTASEAVSAIRTVATLTLEETIVAQYKARLNEDWSKNIIYNLLSSMGYASSLTFSLLVSAFIFWYGGERLIATGEYNAQQFFICFAAVVWGAQAAGVLFSYSADLAGAQEAAARLKVLLSKEPIINTSSDDDGVTSEIVGQVDVQNICFAFPTNPNRDILRDVSFSADFGKFIALVGGSGSGKSTMLNLLERFYKATSGSILVDERDIQVYNLRHLRKEISLVEQEASLVGDTVRECVISDDDTVTDDDIAAACQEANILDFIKSLPEGFNTMVGARGNRLSGGQKQRLAIAKALLRRPKLLLLDEATSALDSESEKLVQQALDKAAKGRTTVAIAHRLSSISHASRIYVFHRGTIIESGTHEELLRQRGRYWELVGLQNLGSNK